MRNLKIAALVASAAALLSACSSTPKLTEAPVVEKPPVAAQPAPDTGSRAITPVETETDELNQPGGVLANRSVYFDFDSYSVRDDAKPVVSNHSNYLTKHTARKVLIQGNTDERGGTEYNLALGQKRAEAVRKSMA